jgi:hypothetical protein
VKFITIILFTLGLVACDPYGFGFKKNPAYILDAVFTDIKKQDVNGFLDVSGKEAFCIYGNSAGIDYLNRYVNFDLENLVIEPKMLEKKHLKAAAWASGFWSYHNERYMVNINSKLTKKTLVQTIVDCDFGTLLKDAKYLDPSIGSKKLKIKECKLVKIIPVAFEPLPLPVHCGNLQVIVPNTKQMLSL